MSSSLPYVLFGNTCSLNLHGGVEEGSKEVVERKLELAIHLHETNECWSRSIEGSLTHHHDHWFHDQCSLLVGLHEFLLPDRSRRYIHDMLASLPIDPQLHVEFEERILAYVHPVGASSLRFQKLVVVAEIEVNKKIMYNEREVIALVERWSAEEYRHAGFGMVAASTSAIESLKIREYEGKGGNEQCMVCLDEFALREKVLCMPCNHDFHKECIVSWLEQSNMCPICRFKI